MIPVGRDHDGPVYTAIGRATHVARKVHGPCGVCGRAIQPGERYHANVYSCDEGGLFVEKVHADVCDEP